MSSVVLNELEKWQLRLVYTALYSALGLVDLSHINVLNLYTVRNLSLFLRQAGAQSSSFDLETASLAGSVNTPFDRYRPAAASISKRFPRVKQMISTFRKHLGDIDISTALRKWRWITRQSSDRIIWLYIRQNGDSLKVMKRIAQTIAWQAHDGHGERELKRGERYYLDIEPDSDYIGNFQRGMAMIVGTDLLHRPFVVVRIREHIMRGQSRESLHRAIANIYEVAFRRQNDDLEGTTTIFDFTGFSMYHHLDLPAMKYVVTLANMAFPCFYSNILVHNAPAYIEPFYQIVKGWLDPFLVENIRFTYKPVELLQYVDTSQLPDFLGGTSTYKNKWIPPREEDDYTMKDFRTKHVLLQERERLLAEFEQLTGDWVCGEELDAARHEQLCDDIATNFAKLDPYVRSRNIFDRQGIPCPNQDFYEEDVAHTGVGCPSLQSSLNDKSFLNEKLSFGELTPPASHDRLRGSHERKTSIGSFARVPSQARVAT